MASGCANLSMALNQAGLDGQSYLEADDGDARLSNLCTHAFAEFDSLAHASTEDQVLPLTNLPAELSSTNSFGQRFAAEQSPGSYTSNGYEFQQSSSPYTWSSSAPISPHHHGFQDVNQFSPHEQIEDTDNDAFAISNAAAPSIANWRTPAPGHREGLQRYSSQLITLVVSPGNPTQHIRAQEVHTPPVAESSAMRGIMPSYQHPYSTSFPHEQMILPLYEHDFTRRRSMTTRRIISNEISPGRPNTLPGSASINAMAVNRGQRYERGRVNRRRGGRRPDQKQPVKRYDDIRLQEETNETKRNGACLKCQKFKQRCVRDPDNPTGPCVSCQAILDPLVYRFQCVRYRISDALLHDHDKQPRTDWTTRWTTMEMRDVDDWRSPVTKIIYLTQGISGLCIPLTVREFVPKKGDSLARSWVTNGRKCIYHCAPYAIEDMREAGRVYQAFAEKCLGKYLNDYLANSDPLISETYQMACRYEKTTQCEEERKLLSNVLRLWMGSRMETRSDRICGDEKLGMQPYNGPPCENSGRVLVPPVLSAQIEIIVTTLILVPAANVVLRSLHKLLSTKKEQSRFAVYLAMFILMHSCSLLTAADIRKAQKRGISTGVFRRALIEEIHHGAKILLGHFHWSTKGRAPFVSDERSSLHQESPQADAMQQVYLRRLEQHITSKASLFREIRRLRDFQHELYFISCIFEPDWTTGRSTL